MKHETFVHHLPVGTQLREKCRCSLDVPDGDATEWLARPGGVALISRLSRYPREDLLKAFQSSSLLGNVACPSAAHNNMAWPTDANGQPVSKVDFLRRYKFVITPENTIASSYVTEKLFEAHAAGAVPIYWGDGDWEIYNPLRVLLFGDNAAELVQAAESLVQDAAARESFFSQPVLSPGYSAVVEERCSNFRAKVERAWLRYVEGLTEACRLYLSGPQLQSSVSLLPRIDRGCRAGAGLCCEAAEVRDAQPAAVLP